MRRTSAPGLSSDPARRCAGMTRMNIRFGALQEYEAEPTWIFRNLIVRPQLFEDQIPPPQLRSGDLLGCVRPIYVKRHIAIHSLLQHIEVHSLLQQFLDVAMAKGWQIPLHFLHDISPDHVDVFPTLKRYSVSAGFPI
jgi:hypothetical protein